MLSLPHQVLLTGATGFVGRSLWPALEARGYCVRGLTRNADRARARWPGRDWRQGDVADPGELARAMEGFTAAFYLVHGMGEGGDFQRQELAAAGTFAEAAARAGIRRIVYLGGMRPRGRISEHLQSRLEVGERLRAGKVAALELRASMIVGHGSLSWLIVRDLAARLPFMVLPRWLRSRTQPVAAADVVAALVAAVEMPLSGSAWFDLPGPETVSAREILIRTAAVMGLSRPVMVDVPVLSPWLSSHWVRFVTRAEWSIAREVVLGLSEDLLAEEDRFWPLAGHANLTGFDEAARRAMEVERSAGEIPGAWGSLERWQARWRTRRR